MKPAFRFCWSEVSLLERNGEPVTGCGDLRAGGLRAAGIVVATGKELTLPDRLLMSSG